MLQGLRLSGVNEDIPPQLLPPDVYSSVKNFEPFDIGMRSSRGNAPAFPGALFDPEYMAYNKAAAEFYWLYASSAGIGVTDGQNHFDITPAGGVSSVWPTGWTDAMLNNLVVLNNNVDPPVWWNNEPSSPMEVLPGWPAGWTARAIRSFNYNLIAMDITDGASQFISKLAWSDSSEGIPDSWDPLPENSAGDNVLADSIGALVDGVQVLKDVIPPLLRHRHTRRLFHALLRHVHR